MNDQLPYLKYKNNNNFDNNCCSIEKYNQVKGFVKKVI